MLAAVRRIPAVAALATDSRTPPLRAAAGRPPRPGGAAAGRALVPQPWVEVEGRRCRLDDVLGAGAAELTADCEVRRADGSEVRVEDPTRDAAALAAGADACGSGRTGSSPRRAEPIAGGVGAH